MRCPRKYRALPWLIGVLVTSGSFSPQTAAESSLVEVHGGRAAFDVGTNVLGILVHGKSSAVEGHATIRDEPGGLVLERIEASVPVMTFTTGMGLRDEHMWRHIFTTDDGQLPDVRFAAGETTCSAEVSGRSACKVVGALTLRGTTQPLAVVLKLKRNGNAFQADGEGALKLSAFGIPQPSQLGVKTLDDVTLEIAFTARRSAAQASGTRTQ